MALSVSTSEEWITSKMSVQVQMDRMQIRTILLYEFQKGISAAEAHRNITAVLGADSVSDCTYRKWFKKFRLGNFDLDDEPRSGRPSVIDDDELRDKVRTNPTVAIRELAEDLEVGLGTVCAALHRLGMRKKLCKWVPHALSEMNKTNRVRVCLSLLARHDKCPFFDQFVTCDEKWVFYDNIKRDSYWSEPGQPAQTQPKRNIHSKKVLLCCWWDIRGLIHFELLEPAQTINTALYCEQLERVQAKLIETRPQLVNRKGVVFHQDNARPHVSSLSLKKIKDLGWELLEHPPYSPDLAPSDYHLFRAMTNYFGKKKFNSSKEVKNDIIAFFASKHDTFYQSGIKKLVDRWGKTVANDGDYFDD